MAIILAYSLSAALLSRATAGLTLSDEFRCWKFAAVFV